MTGRCNLYQERVDDRSSTTAQRIFFSFAIIVLIGDKLQHLHLPVLTTHDTLMNVLSFLCDTMRKINGFHY